MPGIFVGLKVHSEDAETLRAFVQEHGFDPLPADDLHMTIFRSKTGDFDFSKVELDTIELTCATRRQLRYFSMKDVVKAPCISLHLGVDLYDLRGKILTDIAEARISSRDTVRKYDFRPHVTLSFQNCHRIRRVPVPVSEIRFAGLIVNACNEDWYKQFL